MNVIANKKRNAMKNNIAALVMALGLALPAMSFAQDANDPRPPRREGGPGADGQRPVPPLFAALDTNHDGVIDADEIKNASAALSKLDKNGDGKLTMDELRPQRPDGGDRLAPPNDRADGPADGQRPRRGSRPDQGQ